MLAHRLPCVKGITPNPTTKIWIRGMRIWSRCMRSSAGRWKILRVSWRLRTPASVTSRAKTGSLKNHRRTGRESRGGPRVHFLGADTGRPSSDCSRLESRYAGRELQAHSDDGLEDGSGTLHGSSKADTPENPSSPSPYLYIGIGMVIILGKG